VGAELSVVWRPMVVVVMVVAAVAAVVVAEPLE
jgi:hypothetical protein